MCPSRGFRAVFVIVITLATLPWYSVPAATAADQTSLVQTGGELAAATGTAQGQPEKTEQTFEPLKTEPAPLVLEAPKRASSASAPTKEEPDTSDAAKGEGRRNENVQVNLVDTNAARDNNVRVGATATIVEEFRVERGYFSAEYGNPSRGPIHAPFIQNTFQGIRSQKGANLHGNIFWNHNNSVFSARSFFQVGGVQAARENQYGAALSAKIWKNGFLIFSGMQDKNRGAVNGNVLIPLLSERTPLSNDPAVGAIVQRLLDAYPSVAPNVAPNRPGFERALNTNSPQAINLNTTTGQLNQRINRRDALILRYAFNGQQINSFQFVKGQNPNTDNKGHTARITWNHVWDPQTVLDVSAGFDRTGNLLLPTGDAVGPIFLNGLQMLGPQSNIPINRAINLLRYNASLQRRPGQHNVAAGFGFTRQQYNGYETEGARPSFQFRDDFGTTLINNLRSGRPSTYSAAFGNIDRQFRNWELQGFAGDHWVLSKKVTVNYGIRWEPWTLPVDALNLSHLNFNSDWNNVGGNAGFSYRLPKGVLRSAFAVFDGQLFPIAYGQDRFNPPYNVAISVTAPNILTPLAALSAADLNGTGRATHFDIDPNLATPYSYQYNLSWENEFARGWRLQLGYVGSRTHKLFHTEQRNRAIYILGNTDPTKNTTKDTNDRRPNPKMNQQFYTLNASRAYYDAGRATLTVPRWRRTTLSAAYWFSKSIDISSDYTVTGGGQERWRSPGQTEIGVHSDQKSLSNFDQPHALLVQGAWDSGRSGGSLFRKLYGGWNLGAVYLLKSGTPFGVDSGGDSPGIGNVDGTNGDRPNVLNPAILGQIVGNPDTSASLLPRTAFRFIDVTRGERAGSLGRNTFRKGKITNLNASLTRSWALPRESNITLRAEAVNLSNTPQFAEPSTSLTSPNFGQVTNTLNDGRTFRFLLRIGF